MQTVNSPLPKQHGVMPRADARRKLPAIASAIGAAARLGAASAAKMGSRIRAGRKDRVAPAEADREKQADVSAAGSLAEGGMYEEWEQGLSAPGDVNYQKSFRTIGLGRSHKAGDEPPLLFATVDERLKLPNRRAVTEHTAMQLAAAQGAEEALLERLAKEQPLMPNKATEIKQKEAREKLKTPSQLQLERRARMREAALTAAREFEEDKLADAIALHEQDKLSSTEKERAKMRGLMNDGDYRERRTSIATLTRIASMTTAQRLAARNKKNARVAAARKAQEDDAWAQLARNEQNFAEEVRARATQKHSAELERARQREAPARNESRERAEKYAQRIAFAAQERAVAAREAYRRTKAKTQAVAQALRLDKEQRARLHKEARIMSAKLRSQARQAAARVAALRDFSPAALLQQSMAAMKAVKEELRLRQTIAASARRAALEQDTLERMTAEMAVTHAVPPAVAERRFHRQERAQRAKEDVEAIAAKNECLLGWLREKREMQNWVLWDWLEQTDSDEEGYASPDFDAWSATDSSDDEAWAEAELEERLVDAEMAQDDSEVARLRTAQMERRKAAEGFTGTLLEESELAFTAKSAEQEAVLRLIPPLERCLRAPARQCTPRRFLRPGDEEEMQKRLAEDEEAKAQRSGLADAARSATHTANSRRKEIRLAKRAWAKAVLAARIDAGEDSEDEGEEEQQGDAEGKEQPAPKAVVRARGGSLADAVFTDEERALGRQGARLQGLIKAAHTKHMYDTNLYNTIAAAGKGPSVIYTSLISVANTHLVYSLTAFTEGDVKELERCLEECLDRNADLERVLQAELEKWAGAEDEAAPDSDAAVTAPVAGAEGTGGTGGAEGAGNASNGSAAFSEGGEGGGGDASGEGGAASKGGEGGEGEAGGGGVSVEEKASALSPSSPKTKLPDRGAKSRRPPRRKKETLLTQPTTSLEYL